MSDPTPLDDNSRWARIMATPPPERVHRGYLTLAFRRPHWHLSDPILDLCYITERPEGGRHRMAGRGIGTLETMTPQQTSVGGLAYRLSGTMAAAIVKRTAAPNQGRHACKCDRCQLERVFVSIATMRQALVKSGVIS